MKELIDVLLNIYDYSLIEHHEATRLNGITEYEYKTLEPSEIEKLKEVRREAYNESCRKLDSARTDLIKYCKTGSLCNE